MGKYQSYYELLKDERWINKREEILQRDNYRCVPCTNKADDLPQLGKILHVHHLIYIKGAAPWEYNNDDLITVCDECHKFITVKIDSCTEIIRRICIDDDLSEQLEYLLKELLYIKNPWEIRKIAKNIHNG